MADPRLEQAVEHLEAAARRLRTEELSPEDAAALVESCAQLATQAATEVDRLVRGAERSGSADDQLRMSGA